MTPEHSNFSEHSEYVEPSQPELITERLTLRHLREADIPDIVEACRDEETLRYTRVPLNYTRTAELHACRRRGLPAHHCPPDCRRANPALGD